MVQCLRQESIYFGSSGGCSAVVVFLNKVDMVDDELLELVEMEVRESFFTNMTEIMLQLFQVCFGSFHGGSWVDTVMKLMERLTLYSRTGS